MGYYEEKEAARQKLLAEQYEEQEREEKITKYDDKDEKIQEVLAEINIGKDPENQTDVIEYFEKLTDPPLQKLTLAPIPPLSQIDIGKPEFIRKHNFEYADYTSEIEKNYKELTYKDGHYYIFCLNLSENDSQIKKYIKDFIKTWEIKKKNLRGYFKIANACEKGLYQIKLFNILRMLNSRMMLNSNKFVCIKTRFNKFPTIHSGLPGSIIQKYKEKMNPIESEKWEKAFAEEKRYRRQDTSGLLYGGGEKKELCTPKKYVRVNGDPFYRRYRLPIQEENTYKSEKDIADCNNPKSSIYALIIFKECGDALIMQYERIIVNNKLYSETYIDKKIVETLCDDEPVESDTEPLNLSDNNLGMFNPSDRINSSDSTDSSGYTLGSSAVENEEDRSGGRKKTRRKKQKKNNTKRDKTKKKNKKRTRRMKR